MRTRVSPIGFRIQLGLHVDAYLVVNEGLAWTERMAVYLSPPKCVPEESFYIEASDIHRPRSDGFVEDFAAYLHGA